MTEQEWLTSVDPAAMLQHLTHEVAGVSFFGEHLSPREPPLVSDRKLWLLIAAVEQIWWGNKLSQSDAAGLRIIEGFADGTTTSADLQRVTLSYDLPGDNAVGCATECIRIHNSKGDPPRWADLLREIIGNPFHPYATYPGMERNHIHITQHGKLVFENLNAKEILSLAEACYLERQDDGTLANDRLNILADALEDANCDNEDILFHLRGIVGCDHCQGAGTIYETPALSSWRKCPVCGGEGLVPPDSHVRGCWVVDLLLGRS